MIQSLSSVFLQQWRRSRRLGEDGRLSPPGHRLELRTEVVDDRQTDVRLVILIPITVGTSIRTVLLFK